MTERWEKQLRELSGNLTTNEVMPKRLAEKLLLEDTSLKDKLAFEELNFPKLEGVLDSIKGLNILAGLQNTKKSGCLTLFRVVRFPTYKRIYEMIYQYGYATLNYEQERILELYQNEDYTKKRVEIKNDPRFWTQPQERVVPGLPLFCLVNDALQIHRAYRGENDQVAIIAVHVPHESLETGKVKLIANPAIDLNYANDERDFELKDFQTEGGLYQIDYGALRARGIDLHEMYAKGLPADIEEAEKLNITQDFFLLDIYKVADSKEIKDLFNDTETLKRNKHFLHGFFGDQNIFARRRTAYLPSECQRILRK